MKIISNQEDMNKTGVYAIKCVSNGRSYVGSTRSSFTDRYGSHLRGLKSDRHFNKKLQSHYNKYGSESMVFEIIEICEPETAFDAEQRLIDSGEFELNLEKRVNVGPKTNPHKNLSDLNYSIRHDIICILNSCGVLKEFCEINYPIRCFFGLAAPQKLSEKTKERMRHKRGPNSARGKPKSEEHKSAIGAARTRYVERMKLAGEWPPMHYKERFY